MIDRLEKKASSGYKISARVHPTPVSSNGPTDTMVYLTRRDRRCGALRTCGVPWSRVGSNRPEGYSGMTRVHSLRRCCSAQSPLKPFKGRARPVFDTENLDSFNEVMLLGRPLRERFMDIVSTSQRLGRADPLHDVGRIQSRAVSMVSVSRYVTV